jgi:hypothetical protein
MKLVECFTFFNALANLGPILLRKYLLQDTFLGCPFENTQPKSWPSWQKQT